MRHEKALARQAKQAASFLGTCTNRDSMVRAVRGLPMAERLKFKAAIGTSQNMTPISVGFINWYLLLMRLQKKHSYISAAAPSFW